MFTMSSFARHISLRKSVTLTTLCAALLACSAVHLRAQTVSSSPKDETSGLQVRVTGTNQRVEMLVKTSKIITMPQKIPQYRVNNEDLVTVAALSPNQIQISALKTGVTQINIWDEDNKIYTLDVIIMGDARELEDVLRREFPQASLNITALPDSVAISGFVPSADMVPPIIQIAELYFPSVINYIKVGGAQTVLLHVKVLEVSRTRLRKLGVDWAFFNGDDGVVSHAAGLIGSYNLASKSATAGAETIALGIVDGSTAFFTFIDALRDHGLAKIHSEPTLTTTSGRPASFRSGGEFPILVPQNQGTISVDFREFGTQIDFVPIVLGNGYIHLEVRPEISALDEGSGVSFGGTTVPGLRKRSVDTGVQMMAGQTLALAGLIQTQTDSRMTGVPFLAELPGIGAAFRRTEESMNEIELLILVTPEFVAPMNPQEVPACGPGESTTAPTDAELYYRGYVETPKCCTDGSCGSCATAGSGVIMANRNLSPGQPTTRPTMAGRPNPMTPAQPINYNVYGPPQGSNQYPAGVRNYGPNPNNVPRGPVGVQRPAVAPRPALIGPVGYDPLQ